MAPVIRVSDEVFRRLQGVSEPLIDTPSRVIERLIAHYEATNRASAGASTSERPVALRGPARRGEIEPRQVFLAPAGGVNLDRSIKGEVVLGEILPYLNVQQAEQLRNAFDKATRFRCWAMSETRRSVFEAMRPGDRVLFTETGTGRFTFGGTVRHKLVSEAPGNAMWEEQPGLPWKYIYFLADVEPLDISKEKLVGAFGYKPWYRVLGVMQARDSNVRTAISAHGSFEKLLAACHA